LFLGSNSEAQAFLQRNGQVIIRMRGLPFDATAKDVVRENEKDTYKQTNELICLFRLSFLLVVIHQYRL